MTAEQYWNVFRFYYGTIDLRIRYAGGSHKEYLFSFFFYDILNRGL